MQDIEAAYRASLGDSFFGLELTHGTGRQSQGYAVLHLDGENIFTEFGDPNPGHSTFYNNEIRRLNVGTCRFPVILLSLAVRCTLPLALIVTDDF